MKWKPIVAIAGGSGIIALALASFAWMGAKPGSVEAKDQPNQGTGRESFFSRWAAPLRTETATLPAGTNVHIRLVDSISTERNTAGENFAATLDRPLMVENEVVAPAGSTIFGQLTRVRDAGRVEGRASLTMVLRKVIVNDNEYEVKTEPVTLVARSTRKKDATVIAGGAALGAAIGAIAGGGKGAAVGAGVGGGSGTGYVLATKGEPVEYGPETRFTFALSQPLDLPVYRKSG